MASKSSSLVRTPDATAVAPPVAPLKKPQARGGSGGGSSLGILRLEQATIGALKAPANRPKLAYGVVLLLAVLLYLIVAYAYIPQVVPSDQQVKAQTYTNVGFSAFLAVVNGIYYVTLAAPAAPMEAGGAAVVTKTAAT